MKVVIGMNDFVWVKLSQEAIEVDRKNHERLFGKDSVKHPYKEPEADENGWVKRQLWMLFEDFGPSIHAGGRVLIDSLMVDGKPIPERQQVFQPWRFVGTT